LLSYLQTDLDVMLLLESQYSYSNLFLNLQKSNRPMKADYDFYNEDDNINNENDFNDELNDTMGQTNRPDDLLE
jgi:hypothetical protein